ncbi:MAG: DUF1552 domain-containing protein [Planctomycetia bacterium]|nr:DUF1552 domain-containing protein [Gemmataceae bacterium]NBT62256.1 DUF1552 domain-containing protein [Planctomycetia bacterium]
MIKRREMILGIPAGFGALLGTNLLSGITLAAEKPAINTVGGPKRIIFFLQNHGFDPLTCIPKGLSESCALDGITLEKPMQALEPYKNRMHIVTGLHGRHTSPGHSAFFGALGAYRGGTGVPPSAATIDYALSQSLPQTILPPLCIGMESLESMKARPTLATLTASGPNQPIFMHCDPNMLYQMLFGSIAEGDIKKHYQVRSDVMLEIEYMAKLKLKGLPQSESERYEKYVNGFRDLNGLREKLSKISGQLRKYAPKLDDRYSKPKFETDWHDALLEIGIAALQANLTNVLTIASGCGEYFGSWKGLGVSDTGHGLGHIDQPGNGIWTKIRHYNCEMLVKLMKALEAIPEGAGSMMDNTLIVYSSNNGKEQHTDGSNWPFVLLGNGGGRFKTGQYTHVKERPINDLYTTFLRGVGAPVDRFNLDKNMANLTHSKLGPIEELLA